MLRFLFRRLFLVLPALLGLLVLTFVLVRIVPSDPAGQIAGENATPAQLEQIRAELGLDKPLYLQFATYVGQVAKLDFGNSFYSRRPVTEDIVQRLPATMELAFVVIVFSTIVGVILGVVAAIFHNGLIDNFLRSFSVVGLAFANFWLAIMFQLLFSMELGWAPLRGRLPVHATPPETVTGMYLIDSLIAGNTAVFWSAAAHLALPALVLCSGPIATIARFTRSGMLETLQKDFVTYERAVGYPRRIIIWVYVLRNSVMSAITQVGLIFGHLLGGAVVVEAIFDFPGLGLYMVQSILNADYNAVMAATLVAGFIYAFVNIAVDLVHAFVDPRVAEQI